jgi:hypothetical protein
MFSGKCKTSSEEIRPVTLPVYPNSISEALIRSLMDKFAPWVSMAAVSPRSALRDRRCATTAVPLPLRAARAEHVGAQLIRRFDTAQDGPTLGVAGPRDI